jgi:potassium-dependent mechanosensitive channel
MHPPNSKRGSLMVVAREQLLRGPPMIRRSLLIALLSVCGAAAIALDAGALEHVEIAQAAPPTQAPASQDENAAPPAEVPPPAAEAPAPTPAPAPAATKDAVESPLPKVNPPTLEELLEPIGTLAATIDAAEQGLQRPPEGQKDLADLRSRIEKLGFKAKAAADSLRPRLEEVRTQIDKLGEPPAEGAPPEAPEVVDERDRLNAVAAQIDGAIKKAGLIEVRAQQLVSRVQHVRQGIFTRFLLRQSDSPLQPAVWDAAAEHFPDAIRNLNFILSNWWSVAVSYLFSVLGVLAAAVCVYFVLRFLVRRFLRARLDSQTHAPSLPERAGHAVWVTGALAFPAVGTALTLYIGLDELGLLYWQVERLAQALLSSFLIYAVIAAFARAVLQPTRPTWRLFDLSNTSAATIAHAVQAIAAVYAIDFLARRLSSILSLPADSGIVVAFAASFLITALLLVIVRTPFEPRAAAPGLPVSRWRPYWLKLLLLAVGAAVLGTALLGYVSLARFLIGQLLMTGSGLLLIVLLHIAIKGVGGAPDEPGNTLNTILERGLKLKEESRLRVLRLIKLLLNLMLFAVAVPLILLGWGISDGEIMSWLRRAVLGFEVGGVHISLVRILMAPVLFAILLGVTRLFQRWLATQALPKSRLDPGLINSIYTGAGYLGFAVAVLVAVSYAGFDITSLAIVAGALSVGIGFGLQSIVNNFVSGLVLLVERPIKVGDWIATKDGEGYVRRISVRATEIETFDRASLIVPNSELITQSVTNLTHRNQLGRLTIAVRISYAADPELAENVLQQVAENNTSILRHPPPVVVLDKLGEQAMEYSVRIYLADINRSLQVQTEIRTQIVKALLAAGVDIPYFAVQVGHSSGPRLVPHRVSVRIGTALDSDPDKVLDALATAAQRCPQALDKPTPDVTFDNVADGALEFTVSVSIDGAEQSRSAETALRSGVVRVLQERGIALAGATPSNAARDESARLAAEAAAAEVRQPKPVT